MKRPLEGQMSIPGQFLNRPREVAGWINEPFAAGVIYPAVLAAWMFLTLAFPWSRVSVWPAYAVWITIILFLGGLAVAVFYNRWLRKHKAKLVSEAES